MFGLEDRHIEFIKQVLDNTIADDRAQYFIFGSRAKGTNAEYSDIDIAIKLENEKLTSDVLGKILIEFQDSTLPYQVDVIDLNAIDDKFKSMIQESLIAL